MTLPPDSTTRQLAITTALRTIEIEQETLAGLSLGINADFASVVEILLQLQGRIVVTGIGKSAIVAQKMVATFNSTGSPALFMHAADAIHGDLGMITKADAVICISKSGNTPEIKALLPLLKGRCHTLVAMAAQTDSYLALGADFLLHTPVAREADPNNLAPTASTIAQMAMGDALATALIACRGFLPEDFAHVHPGGALGKQLYLRVADLVILHGKPNVAPQAPLLEVLQEMTQHRLGATAVLNEKGGILGVITDGDLRRALSSGADFSHLLAKDIMHQQPKIIESELLAVQALRVLKQFSINQLLVVDADKNYVGIVHLHDLLREGLV